ncbi:hypothetical protein LSH36_43g05040 [Paralvinella palmiformis]|uniref:CCD97-like C-terminal domain-containing protein n=1 Tax=Paralvinella palmiformis TaxID=53620 RepID=A0AAD9NF60_9ANNE|nr:hypothetical protein LSH36_43g05040 [Paralvinella palmiformis]
MDMASSEPPDPVHVQKGDAQDPVKSDSVKAHMLDRIAKTDAHFKHQQRGEPDLTFEDKRTIADELLERNPGTFLSRFSKYLVLDDLVYFRHMHDDYTVNFFVKEVEDRFADSRNHKVRNRRYEAMKELVTGGVYFSDCEMKSRDPLLYEQMVGQYLTEEEILAEVQKHDGAISSVLFDHIEIMYNNELYAKQVEQEECQLEEGDSDEESDEQELMEDKNDDGERKQISEGERQMLRNEFISIMKQRFIHGEDHDFDYQTVDDCEEYDSLDIRTQDEEEKYFDADDSQSMNSQNSDDIKLTEMHITDNGHQNMNGKMQQMEL